MDKGDFVSYIGHADLHDARIVSVGYTGDQFKVVLRSPNGRELEICFTGVKGIIANQPVGMMIYALNEMRADAPFRRFVFTNWDEEDSARLELEAQKFTVLVDGSRLTEGPT